MPRHTARTAGRTAMAVMLVLVIASCGSDDGRARLPADQLVRVDETRPTAPDLSATSAPTGGTPVISAPASTEAPANRASTAPSTARPPESSPAQDTTASDQGSAPTIAPSDRPAFPLSIEEGSRVLTGSDGAPVLIMGEAAWSLMAQLDRAEVDQYLENRRARGFNAVLVSLIEHTFSSNPPANRAGDQPFTTPGDFSTPNEAYFAHTDWVLQRLSDEGFVVFLTPDYAGYPGTGEGWWDEMVANGAEVLEAYGRFVGERYRRFDNIVWVNGGDLNPDLPELIDAVARGLTATDPDALQTAHLQPDTPPRDFWSDAEWLDIDGVYTYDPVYDSAIAAYESSGLPYLMQESSYENEHDATTRQLRTQAYHALFSGAAGHIFGNNPIWHFDGGGLFDAPVTWQEALDGPGSASMTAIADLMATIAWPDLVPDVANQFVTSGHGKGQERVAAAVAGDAWGVAYVPTGRTLTLDLGRLRGDGAQVTWYDASNGRPTWNSVVEVDGLVDLETPGDNEAGDDDWVLLVEPRPAG